MNIYTDVLSNNLPQDRHLLAFEIVGTL